MSERKPCIRCERPIDAYARICPFCNWDQTEIPPRQEEPPPEPPAHAPPEHRWRGKILAAVAFVALIIIAFVVGMLIHGIEPSEVKAAQTKNATGPTTLTPAPRSNVTLVPVTSTDMPQSIEQPITTAPPQAPGQQPNDATALPADQYAAAAARAKAEREAAAKGRSLSIDPRTLTGPAYEPSERRSRPEGSENATVERTRPVPEYQPTPDIMVNHRVTARLNLTVGEDGHVSNIDIEQTIPDMMKLISAVQNWRFKPATENGRPVASRYSVEIVFNPQ